MIRVGTGIDVHRLVEGRDLWIGGVKIAYSKGLLGHSDADVALHALCDALLGAANLRDIGYHFPDTDPKYKGIDSKKLLAESYRLVKEKGYKIVNADMTICAEQPKLNPHIPLMQEVIAKCLECEAEYISIKATTTEKLGYTGRGEGISAYATVLIEKE
ncbi:MAG: 2-C-methyl-D-erythritol 2,4-cyclodiphosphate synthase [Muribaculaceae bacterium]|jgi:2-C-methyl-D-erythritol 2,4-cyclodiphosphate synthase|nr:2-C-methyl-D-erythritol 2,4-cyclodiphosphate synthase [Muribaculaceae bacterium]